MSFYSANPYIVRQMFLPACVLKMRLYAVFTASGVNIVISMVVRNQPAHTFRNSGVKAQALQQFFRFRRTFQLLLFAGAGAVFLFAIADANIVR